MEDLRRVLESDEEEAVAEGDEKPVKNEDEEDERENGCGR